MNLRVRVHNPRPAQTPNRLVFQSQHHGENVATSSFLLPVVLHLAISSVLAASSDAHCY